MPISVPIIPCALYVAQQATVSTRTIIYPKIVNWSNVMQTQLLMFARLTHFAEHEPQRHRPQDQRQHAASRIWNFVSSIPHL